jgi:hypothetical protein
LELVFGVTFFDAGPSPIFGRTLKLLVVDEGVLGELAVVGFLAVVVKCGVGMVELFAFLLPASVLLFAFPTSVLIFGVVVVSAIV